MAKAERCGGITRRSAGLTGRRGRRPLHTKTVTARFEKNTPTDNGSYGTINYRELAERQFSSSPTWRLQQNCRRTTKRTKCGLMLGAVYDQTGLRATK